MRIVMKDLHIVDRYDFVDIVLHGEWLDRRHRLYHLIEYTSIQGKRKHQAPVNACRTLYLIVANLVNFAEQFGTRESWIDLDVR